MAMLNYRRVIDHLESRWHNGTTPKKVEGMYMGAMVNQYMGVAPSDYFPGGFLLGRWTMIQFDKSDCFFPHVSCCFCLKTKEARGTGLFVRE